MIITKKAWALINPHQKGVPPMFRTKKLAVEARRKYKYKHPNCKVSRIFIRIDDLDEKHL